MFKVGDWVRVLKKDGAINSGLIGRVTGTPETTMYDNSIWIQLENGFSSSTKLSNLELWQPKESEWCWYPADYGAGLIRYDGKGNMELYEPFIGELPIFLKDR